MQVKLLQVLDHPHVIKYMNSYIVDNELIIELEFAEVSYYVVLMC